MNQALWLAMFALLLGSAPTLRAQTSIAAEQDLKAAYLYHFIQFTEWPQAALPPLTPVRICIDAGNPLARALTALDRTAPEERSIIIDTSAAASDQSHTHCHVWVLDSRTRRAPAGLATQPILTLSTGADVAPEAAVIAMHIRQGHVTFSVNNTLAQRQGLRISSKLLRLAESVQ